ncbi:MAG: ATP-binding protein [Chloroflexota bacterium]
MTVVNEYRLSVPAVLENVEAVCQWVADIGKSICMPEDAIHRCYLAVEEICTNIIEHGYHFDGADKVIELICRAYPNRLAVTIIDDAVPFNPLDREDPDPSAPLIEREGGGWGIFFVKKYMDVVSYSYRQSRNQLTVEKLFQPV